MRYIYTAVLSPTPKKVYAKVPDLPGCVTTGRTVQEAASLIADALALYLVSSEDDGSVIPSPTPQQEIPRDPDDVLTLVTVDTLAYRAKTDTRAVRKNVSLPAWMVKMADAQGINCSKVLQDALRTQLR